MKTETLKIDGMTCGGCVNAVTRALKAVKGVSKVVVLLDTGEATIVYDEELTSSDVLRNTIYHAGYTVGMAATPH